MRKVRGKREYNLHIDKVEVAKPELKPGESQSDWMSRCIPVLIAEGKNQEQAAGQCSGMWVNKKEEDDDEIDFEGESKKFVFETYTAPEDFDLDDQHITKGQELQFVLGVVLEPETIDATTTEKSIGDIYNADEVRKAAHNFMVNYSGRGNDLMHNGLDNSELKIVESYVAPTDLSINGSQVKKGTWMMGTLIFDSTVWEAVKTGKISGYSIGGKANAKFEEAAAAV